MKFVRPPPLWRENHASPDPPFAVSAAALALCLGQAPAADVPDLAKLDRTLKKEPAYVCKKPLYGLAVFGPKAEKRVWLVLDKSKPDATAYDVLHIDRNADGDLTGPGERVKAAEGEFPLGDFTDPATGAKHPDGVVLFVWGGPDRRDVQPAVAGPVQVRRRLPRGREAGYMAVSRPGRPTACRVAQRRRPFPLPAVLVRRQTARRRGRGLQGVPGPAGAGAEYLRRGPGANSARQGFVRRRSSTATDGQGATAGVRTEGALLEACCTTARFGYRVTHSRGKPSSALSCPRGPTHVVGRPTSPSNW